MSKNECCRKVATDLNVFHLHSDISAVFKNTNCCDYLPFSEYCKLPSTISSDHRKKRSRSFIKNILCRKKSNVFTEWGFT